jgi:hypothetical protein
VSMLIKSGFGSGKNTKTDTPQVLPGSDDTATSSWKQLGQQ